MAEIGSWIDERYRILSQLGEGGTSNVYLAWDRQLQTHWAVKEIPAAGAFIRQSRGAWNEIEVLRKLNHPGIPRIVSVISQDQCFYMVMDYVKGRSLDRIRIEQDGVSPDRIIGWGLQLCDIFSYLHGRTPPVIYRDLKPEHVLEKEDGTLVLVDFGIAESGSGAAREGHMQLATPGFASPEQLQGAGGDERSDLYSLGVTLFWLWKGRFPWEKRQGGWSLRQADLRLERILRSCTRSEPGQRYQTVRILQSRLLALQKKREQEILPRVCIRLVLFGAAFICCVLAGSQRLLASPEPVCISAGAVLAREKVQENRQILARAQKAPKEEEKKKLIRQALKKNPMQKSGYEALFALWKQDGVLKETERQELERMLQAEKELLEGSELYGELLYQTGRLYWYYYEAEELRMSVAVPWFEEAETCLRDPEKAEQAAVYVEIGNFYRSIKSLVAEGTEHEAYRKLWQSLGRMKELLWQEQMTEDTCQIRLEFAKLAVTAAESYGEYWLAMGVERAQILELVSGIKASCTDIKPAGELEEQIRSYVLLRAEKVEQMWGIEE